MSLKSKLDLNVLPSDIANVPVLRLAGTLDIYSAQELRKLMEKFSGDIALKNIILLVDDLEYIDSSGIGIIFSVGIKLKKRGGALILVNPQQMVHTALKITRALTQISLCDTFEAAIAAVNAA